jgi:hypothetical protein
MQSARYATVALAFEIYGIPDPPAVRPAARGYLDEVVEKRHAIAHGRESPVTYGKAIRSGELRQRYAALYDQAMHVLACLNAYATGKRFIASRHRLRY